MDLTRVDWSAATIELHDQHRRTGSARTRRALAAASSLRARFTADFTVAAAATAAAIELEPLEPLHRVRDALARLRFGDLDGALARLAELDADSPFVLVVRALATARRGEPRTARNIADRALQVDGKHAAAKFLNVEANLAAQAKGGLDKLAELPRGAAYEPAWADLLARLAIVRPGDHKAIAQQLERGVIAKGSRAEQLARAIASWAQAAPAELVRAAEAQPPGSRAEQLALALAVGKSEPLAAATALREIHRRAPERSAVRRALVAAVSRLAVAEAAAERWAAAQRAVQICLELEPAEPAHYQNRAALFTLGGERDAALDAWADLDRVHYASALLGRLDPASARRYAAPHRMFARAARLTARSGIFVLEASDREGARDAKQLAVHQELIDRDPEQLRHWLHHARAALVFGVVALGTRGERALLAPATPAIATARADGLAALAQSLTVLVPDEGRRLADRLAARFRAAAEGAGVHYVAPEADGDARAVQAHAIELYADLALLSVRWEPDPSRRAVFDEVLETIRAVAPLFDERALAAALDALRDAGPEAAGALRVLDSIMRVVLEISGGRDVALDGPDRARLAGFLAGNLRVSLVERRAIEARGDLSRHEIEQLVEQLDLARKDDPKNARLEYWAAHLLAVGDFLAEAKQAIAAFHAVAKGEHPLAPRIEKVQELIDQKQQHGKGKARSASGGPLVAGDEREIAAREAELASQPTSMQLYTELCHELALAGRWRDAHAWATRALARCLTPAGQLRARELALELLGLEELAAADTGALAAYVAGARASALGALDKLSGTSASAALHFVHGQSLLAADRRADAQRAFARALDRCTRGIFLAVLRPLAKDVEAAVFEAARQDVDAAIADGRFRDAFGKLADRMASVAKAEPYVLELARTQLAALVPTIGTSTAPAAPPPIRVGAAWASELATAIAIASAPDRIRALAQLAARVHEPSARGAEALGRRLDELDDQLAVAGALDKSTELAAAGDFAGALAQLAELGSAADTSARVLRQRAILLLRLERLVDADAAVAKLANSPEPIAREFAARYPALRFRQQIATASGRVRGKDFAGARAALEGAAATTPDQIVELAYCRAYGAAAEGYRAHEAGDRAGARELLFRALATVEGALAEARALGHQGLLDLHKKLDVDVGLVEGAQS